MVEDAFAATPYPGDDQIVPDPERNEMDELYRNFRGRHWRDVPREALAWHSGDAILFTPPARKFYLPAYMLAGLDGFRDLGGACLVLLTTRALKDEFRAYSPAQKAAIRAFLPIFGGDNERTRGFIEELWS